MAERNKRKFMQWTWMLDGYMSTHVFSKTAILFSDLVILPLFYGMFEL